jgi:hypothetical protein
MRDDEAATPVWLCPASDGDEIPRRRAEGSCRQGRPSSGRMGTARPCGGGGRREKAGGRVSGGGDELVRAAGGSRIKPDGELPCVEVVAEVAGGGGWVRAAVAELPTVDELLLPLRRWHPGRFGEGEGALAAGTKSGGAGGGERRGGRWRRKPSGQGGGWSAWGKWGKWELGVGVSVWGHLSVVVFS